MRIHTDASAARAADELDAKAFTHGEDIFFGAGNYQPGTPDGQHLLAHELAHTMQQGPTATSTPKATDLTIVPPDHSQEREAEAAAHQVAKGHGVANTTLSRARTGIVGKVARQPQSGQPVPSGTPAQRGPTQGGTTQGFAGAREMRLEANTRLETQVTGELAIENRPRVVHERRIHIRTESGAEVDVTINGSTDLPLNYDTSGDANAALFERGEARMGYTLFGHLADGTPVAGMGQLGSDNSSLAALASTGPEFIHFGLTYEQQYQSVVDALRHTVGEPVWRESERKAQQRQQVQYPSEDEFAHLSRGEKKDLAHQKFWEEFNWGAVVKGILIGAAILGVAVLAVLAAMAGWAAVAFGLAVVAIAAAVVGLIILVQSMVQAVAESWRRGDVAAAILEVIKYVALIAAIIIGSIVLIAAVITAGAVILKGLAIAAVVLLAMAAIAGIILVFMHLDRAADAERVDEFQHYVKQAAREAEEFAINLVLLIISIILGPLARRLSEGQSGKGTPPGQIEGQPGPLVEGEQPIPTEGIPWIRSTLGGTAERIILPNGRSALRLSVPSGDSITAEVLSRTRVPAGEVQRVRLPNGSEEEVLVFEEGEGGLRWRALSPEEVEALGRGETGVRGGRPRPAAPTDPPRQPDGTIDYVAWEQRLRSKGIRGEVTRKIQEAQAGNRDSEAELRLAERYVDAGYEVEIVRPAAETLGGGPTPEARSPDIRVTRPGRAPVRTDVKFREPGRPLTRRALNGMVDDANDQVRSSFEGRGDILIDASEAAPDSMSPVEVEAFLRGKLTGSRFAPGLARLTNVEHLEVTYRAGGRLNRSYIFRDANGNAHGPFTEVLE